MPSSDIPSTSHEVYRALALRYGRDPFHAALVQLLFRLSSEVEALREALSSPETPEAVREVYRQAYARTAVLSHNAAGPLGGPEKVLRRFFPAEEAQAHERFHSEVEMMKRLGATPEEQQALRDKMEEVEMYT